MSFLWETKYERDWPTTCVAKMASNLSTVVVAFLFVLTPFRPKILGPQQPMSQLDFSSVFSLMGPPNTAHTLVSFTIASSTRLFNDCPIVYADKWPQMQWQQADERARSDTATFAPIYASSVASCLTKGLADRRAAVLLSPVHGGKGADPLKEKTIAEAVQPARALSGQVG